jgi:hypothetical protein
MCALSIMKIPSYHSSSSEKSLAMAKEELEKSLGSKKEKVTDELLGIDAWELLQCD